MCESVDEWIVGRVINDNVINCWIDETMTEWADERMDG